MNIATHATVRKKNLVRDRGKGVNFIESCFHDYLFLGWASQHMQGSRKGFWFETEGKALTLSGLVLGNKVWLWWLRQRWRRRRGEREKRKKKKHKQKTGEHERFRCGCWEIKQNRTKQNMCQFFKHYYEVRRQLLLWFQTWILYLFKYFYLNVF